jgi:hypothetical protein
MNIPSYEFDPRFVHQTLREKRARAACERLAREVLRTSEARTPALYPVRRLVGLQLIALGTALQGSPAEA